jgi:16S rRNA (cytosine1402-N4)-methyltransferase
LEPKPNLDYIDATLGFGGHTEAILKETGPSGKVYGIDQDNIALKSSKTRLKDYVHRFIAIKGNFSQIDELVPAIKISGGILADIGVSSVQLDESDRGFSFGKNGPLDMRMDQDQELTAQEIVNNYSQDEIERILKVYGEERFAKRIAQKIVENRQVAEVITTSELAEIISKAVPRKFWPTKIHPATKSFQAIRMAVNSELEVLTEFIPKAFKMLEPGARLAIITFHSLEDRIVKEEFEKLVNPCVCPPEFPKCVCGKRQSAKYLGKKFYVATEEEISANPRSRSAKLRVIEKI